MLRRVLFTVAVACWAATSSARADVDLTGRWQLYAFGFNTCLDIVQTGATLDADDCEFGTIWSGTIDPMTGSFTLAHPGPVFCPPDPPGGPCVVCSPAEITATATPDGLTFVGNYFQPVLVFPLNCSGIDGSVYGSRVVCGDGVQQVTEQCDDGNTDDGDCCSSGCQYEAAGSPCFANGLCSVQQCDGVGVCEAGVPPSGCLTAAKSSLLLRSAPDPAKDKLIWKWLKGAAMSQTGFGDPRLDTDYSLCLYTGTAQSLLGEASVGADAGTWSAVSTLGYQYKDRSGAADGITKILLKGAAAGHSKALLKGKGANLPDHPPTELTLPVTVRLVGSGGAACLESVFENADVIANDGTDFKAKVK